MSITKEDITMENIIAAAISLPGVKVSRADFLKETFETEQVDLEQILEKGPIAANCSEELLSRLADAVIRKRVSESAIASFVAGLPGGLLMGIAIPADIVQFFAVALAMAQEISYLYGMEDMWRDEKPDMEMVNERLALYCGVMFETEGADRMLRVSAAPSELLTSSAQEGFVFKKTLRETLISRVGIEVGSRVAKDFAAHGVAMIIPVVGGVISGSMTYSSMKPMGTRLADVFEYARFRYNKIELETDIKILNELAQKDPEPLDEKDAFIKGGKDGLQKGMKEVGTAATGLFNKVQKAVDKVKKG